MSEISNVGYIYENLAIGVHSSVDHFIRSEYLYQLVFENSTLHEGNNLCDHSPIFMTFRWNVHSKINNKRVMYHEVRQMNAILMPIKTCSKLSLAA